VQRGDVIVARIITPDLRAIARGIGASISPGLSVKWVEDAKGRPALRVQPTKLEFAAEDEWIVTLSNIEFTNGIIEFDALGQSEPPQSNFLGVAFHVLDEGIHDAVYFRPFNFRAPDTERSSHAVQYISHPRFRWFDLRKDKPGQFEQPIVPPPDGDGWFSARIVVQRPKVSVYVNAADRPSLVVNELSDRNGGAVGLWVGPGQGGYVANLRITATM
jgi:hypothetical protein